MITYDSILLSYFDNRAEQSLSVNFLLITCSYCFRCQDLNPWGGLPHKNDGVSRRTFKGLKRSFVIS